ncbi:MAG: hypothetical protein ACK4TJ_16605, partial [Tabrizicola sp.]
MARAAPHTGRIDGRPPSGAGPDGGPVLAAWPGAGGLSGMSDMQDAERDEGAPGFALTFGDAEARFLARAYAGAGTILEYGSGGSTVLAAELGARVFAVESDRDWAVRLASHVAGVSDRVQVHWADIGPTGAWGVPLKPREHHKFHRYALSVWDRPDFVQPDLVLIDGRFRCACLVAVMLRTNRPVT